MEQWLGSLSDGMMQCWGCPVFDRLFQVVSNAAAAAYRPFSLLCAIIFCVLMAFYILHAFADNLGMYKISEAKESKDWTYVKYFKGVIANSLVVFAILALGVQFPRMISEITFEPVADIALVYTEVLVQTDKSAVDAHVAYQPKPMEDKGFYRVALRDKVIQILKTTITQFQAMVKLGIAIMDNAFTWKAFLGIGALLKRIVMFFLGFMLVWGFFKLFVKFCFYFADIIIAMAFYAFFLPLTLILMVFKNADAPAWMKGLGGGLGGFFKDVVNAIVSLCSVVIAYSVIMVLIAKFFATQGGSGTELAELIMSGQIYSAALSDDSLSQLTLMSSIVLMYIISFMADKIPDITKEFLGAFDVKDNNTLGEELGKDALKFGKQALGAVKSVSSMLLGKEEKIAEKKEEKK